jgi:hypothetical protein
MELDKKSVVFGVGIGGILGMLYMAAAVDISQSIAVRRLAGKLGIEYKELKELFKIYNRTGSPDRMQEKINSIIEKHPNFKLWKVVMASNNLYFQNTTE